MSNPQSQEVVWPGRERQRILAEMEQLATELSDSFASQGLTQQKAIIDEAKARLSSAKSQLQNPS